MSKEGFNNAGCFLLQLSALKTLSESMSCLTGSAEIPVDNDQEGQIPSSSHLLRQVLLVPHHVGRGLPGLCQLNFPSATIPC